jgi:glycosyltransferase involved in cell wall biosynthesis
MQFSVVIPTHDRLQLLSDAIETVRRQGDDIAWDLLVFDNASEEPIGAHVESLADRRIRYARSDAFLPVTESWNQAIDRARGDYVIVLGDDDGLAPGYFSKLRQIIDDFERPEIVYTALYQFMHPGVAPWDPSGYVADVRNGFFFREHSAPFRLEPSDMRHAVVGSLHLRRNFTFNIQAFVFKNEFLTRLRREGPVFRSPFPDYYLANVAFARSGSTVIVPAPLVIAGVSKASFGFTLFNGLEARGEALLNAKLASDPVYRELEARLLPGPAYNSNYVVTMEYVARNLGDAMVEQVDFGRYRRLQIFSALQRLQEAGWSDALWDELRRRLSMVERYWAAGVSLLLRSSGRVPFVRSRMLPWLRRKISPYEFPSPQRICDRGGFSRLLELYAALESGALR